MKEFFEFNRQTHSEPTHQATSLSSGIMIQCAHASGLEVASVSYWKPEELFITSGVENYGSVGPDVGRRSPYPSQCGSTIVQSLASRSQYSPPTIQEGIQESVEQFSRLAPINVLFAKIDVLLSQETTINRQFSGIDWSFTWLQVENKSQAQIKSRKATYNLSRPVRPKAFQDSNTEKWGGFSPRRCSLKLHLLLCLLLARKIPSKTNTVSVACCASIL